MVRKKAVAEVKTEEPKVVREMMYKDDKWIMLVKDAKTQEVVEAMVHNEHTGWRKTKV